jgi:hypothetical protein
MSSASNLYSSDYDGRLPVRFTNSLKVTNGMSSAGNLYLMEVIHPILYCKLDSTLDSTLDSKLNCIWCHTLASWQSMMSSTSYFDCKCDVSVTRHDVTGHSWDCNYNKTLRQTYCTNYIQWHPRLSHCKAWRSHNRFGLYSVCQQNLHDVNGSARDRIARLRW